MKIKYKKIISVLIIVLLLGFIFSTQACAVDDLTNSVITKMQGMRLGVTQETRVTKIIRTIFAMVQMIVTGLTLVYLTAYCVKFFNVFSADERAKAKKGLIWRLIGVSIVFGANFIITIILDMVTA